MQQCGVAPRPTSRGLDLEIARPYAHHGLKLALAIRGAESLRQVEEELCAQSGVLAMPVNVSDEAERLVGAELDRFGRLDVLVKAVQ